MTGIGASQKEKDLSRLLYRICGFGDIIRLLQFLIFSSDQSDRSNFCARLPSFLFIIQVELIGAVSIPGLGQMFLPTDFICRLQR